MSAREEFLEAVRTSAWDEGRKCEHCDGDGRVYPGRRTVHCRLGGFGADWDEQAVLDLIERADDVAWGRSLFGVVIVADVDGKRYAFDQLDERYNDRATWPEAS